MTTQCPMCGGKGSIDTSESPYTAEVIELVGYQLEIMASRARLYGDSWKSEGPDGLMYDILRKLRRLWKVLMLDAKLPEMDDGLDLANYALMLIALTQVEPQSIARMRVKGVRELFGDIAPDAMAPGGKLREGRPNA